MKNTEVENVNVKTVLFNLYSQFSTLHRTACSVHCVLAMLVFIWLLGSIVKIDFIYIGLKDCVNG